MKSCLRQLTDPISLHAVEQFSNRLMFQLNRALNEETVGESVSDIGIGFELSIKILEKELNKAREELSDGCTKGSNESD
jgi:hypothetical protein